MKYRTIGGDLAEMHPSITEERVFEAASEMSLNNPGFCLACGGEAEGCEPDARHYRCDSCGLLAVFGAEEVLLMIV